MNQQQYRPAPPVQRRPQQRPMPPQQYTPQPMQAYAPEQTYNDAYAVCPRCGGKMLPQTVAEMKRRNFFMVIIYILLCVSVIGIPVVIFLLLRGNKSKTQTYMVCQRCGNRIDSRKMKW